MQSPTSTRPAPAPAARSDRDISKVVLGDLLFDTWYRSSYPKDLLAAVGSHHDDTGDGDGDNESRPTLDRLYVCRWCFRYSSELMPYLAHMASASRPTALDHTRLKIPSQHACPAREQPAPGRKLYAKGRLSVYAVDGEEQVLFCQNLSLFATLFLETKSVCFDPADFTYHLLLRADHPAASPQIVAFFSKEKRSWDHNNVACILVFPPWQRKGYGTLLMELSYTLSRREGIMGGPEKPLSGPGRRAYLSFWAGAVARFVLSRPAGRSTTTVRAISDHTFIQPEDVIAALKEMAVVQRKPAAAGKQRRAVRVDKSAVRDWARAHRVALTPVVDPAALVDGPAFIKAEDR
ncbi:MAG: hypothetical protein M1826_006458 [Phylliscum demangeonii]|nr:MAG: hypothetical protein M1826_006458 [Phylliscum demangeonii]